LNRERPEGFSNSGENVVTMLDNQHICGLVCQANDLVVLLAEVGQVHWLETSRAFE
jgi:hypothetical protein